jgi:SRSO17 transposase
MTPLMESTTAPTEPEIAVVQGWTTSLTDIARRLGPYVARAETRQRVMTYRRGRLRPAARKNSWQLAEETGDATPDGFQYVLARADWAADAVHDELRVYIRQHLSDPHGVLVIDETGFLKNGQHSAGVARQSSGPAGKVENCQMGVFVAYASRLGHALLDRERYLPEEWTNDRERCRSAGIPDDRDCATKPQLAQQMLARAFAAGRPAQWVTGDSVYGHARPLRLWLDGPPQADVLAVSGQEYVRLDGRQRQVKTLVAALPPEGWTRLSAGDGTKGPRWYEWRWRPLAEPQEPGWRRWLLVRRSLSLPTELTAYRVFAPQDTTVAEVVPVAGTRWTIESSFEAAQGEVGLDDYEVRSWTGWYRPITLAMWAYALWVVLRAGPIAVEALKKSLPPVQKWRGLASFKAQRGLTSR